MRLERRVGTVLVALAVVTAPAAVLRVLCVGRSCDSETKARSRIPFCSLPAPIRAGIAAGYRDGRSPDVLGVTRSGVAIVSDGIDPAGTRWPDTEGSARADVPVVFVGTGVARGAGIEGAGLDDVAPTLADVLGFDIPHPEVRSGRPVEGVANGDRPGLVVLVVLRQVVDAGTDPVINALAGRGAATLAADPESLPRDDAALIATVGTGGIPAEHGITGSVLRNETARAARAWASSTPRGPRSVIATLADDLDETLRQRPRIGWVTDAFETRGLVGGNWYVDNDVDERRLVSSSLVVRHVARLVDRGFGSDAVPDVIGVSLRTGRSEGAAPALDLLRVAEKAPRGAALAIVILPKEAPADRVVPAADLVAFVERELGDGIVEADTAGGLFLDQEVLAETGTTKDEVVRTMRRFEAGGRRVFADVFPGLAVSFARFC